MNVYEKIQAVRFELGQKELKKTGRNDYSKYDYFELGDFLPEVNELLHKHKLFSQIDFKAEPVELIIINCEKPEEKVTFYSEKAKVELKAAHAIQNIGAIQTYLRRYLYMTAFEISENDMVENSEVKEEKTPEELPKITEIQLKVLLETMKKKGYDGSTWKNIPLKKLNVKEFKEAMDALEKRPDKQEQSNLDL